jgi:hypothetical protein
MRQISEIIRGAGEGQEHADPKARWPIDSSSDVGLLKCLRRSEEWLHWLCIRLVADNGVQMPGEDGPRSAPIVEGTIVKEPGKTGSQWRIVCSCGYRTCAATISISRRRVAPGPGKRWRVCP